MIPRQFVDIPIDTCFPPIAQTTVEFTKSNDDWNQLATNFVNGMSSKLSNDMIEEIGNLFFGKTNDFGQVLTDLFNTQVPIIVFFSIGIAFSALTLIGAVVTLIWACTCRWKSKGIKSPCMNITGLIIAFISFGFVVAGITLYSLSIDSFVNGVLKAPNQVTTIVGNVNNFTQGAAIQVGCAVTNGFSSISNEVTKLPDEIIDKFESTPEVIGLIGPDYAALGKTFSDNKGKVDDILAMLNTALANQAVSGNEAARTAVDTARQIYATLDASLDPATANNVPTTLTKLGTQVTNFQKTTEQLVRDQAAPIAAQATKLLNDMIGTVNGVVDAINNAIDSAVNVINNVLDFMKQLETDLNEHDQVTGWITAGFKSLIAAPSTVALAAATVAFMTGVFYACRKKSLPSKGCCSASCTLITLSVIVLAVAFVVMVPASLIMALGYGSNLVCQPFFYDDSLQALKAVDNIVGNLTIQSMTPNKQVVLKFSEMMVQCKNEDTFMQAVKGDEIIDVNVITGAINVDQLTNDLDTAIDNAPITPLGDADFDALTATLSAITFVPDLTAARAVDQNEIDAIKAQMEALAAILQPAVDACNSAAEDAKTFTDVANIKKLLKTTSNDFIKSLFDDLTTTANTFKGDLIRNSAPCTPVYRSYEDIGLLGCEQMAGGLQGMWAAAGLAAIFFLPTVIAGLCVASVLRAGKIKEEEEAWLPPSTTPMVSPYAAQYTEPEVKPTPAAVPTAPIVAAAVPPPPVYEDKPAPSAPLDTSAEDSSDSEESSYSLRL